MNSRNTSGESREAKTQVCSLVDAIFRQFSARCRNWQRDIPDQAALNAQKNLYVELLLRSGIRDSEVIKRAAGKVCSELRWYQLPDDFIVICRGVAAERAGLPDVNEAHAQAVGLRSDKHPAVVYTLRNIDSFALRIASTGESVRIFSDGWNKTIAFILAGGELPEQELQIDDQHPAADKATALGFLADIRGSLSS